MKKQFVVIACLVGVVSAAYGQSFNINFITGPNPVFDMPLRLGTSGEVLAPAGSTIWFIQDTADDGFFASSLTGITLSQANSMLAVGSDDAVMPTSSIGGPIVDGATVGLTKNLGRTDNLFKTTTAGLDKTVDIYAILWTGASGNVVSVGDTFGFLNLGTLNGANFDIGLNTYNVAINSSIYSGTISVVPEPSSYAAIFGLTSLLGAIAYRRFKK